MSRWGSRLAAVRRGLVLGWSRSALRDAIAVASREPAIGIAAPRPTLAGDIVWLLLIAGVVATGVLR